MKLNALLLGAFLLPTLALADASVVEAFKDKGEYFVKAGTRAGLKIGSEVTILGDQIGDSGEYRTAGKGTVLEVWENLARVNLDEEASKLKEVKHARVAKLAPKPAPSAPAGQAAAPAAPAPAPAGGKLNGHAAINGFGPAKRITLFNDSKDNWTKCDLRLPDNRHYVMASLKAGDSEAVSLPHFSQDGTAFDKPLDSLSVKCNEGEGRFNFSM